MKSELKPWFSKFVESHVDCVSGQDESINKMDEILINFPWCVINSITGAGKSHMCTRVGQNRGGQILTITAANALTHHKNLMAEHTHRKRPGVENYCGVMSYDMISFNNISKKNGGERGNYYISRDKEGNFLPTIHFRKITKKYGWTLIIDEIQKTKNTINYSQAIRVLIEYIVYRFFKASKYDDDDNSEKAIKAREQGKSRIIFSSFCPFDSIKQLKTFCWFSCIIDEEPEMSAKKKEFKKQIQDLIDIAEECRKRKTLKLTSNIPSGITERYELITNLTEIIWNKIAVDTKGVKIDYECEYYDMFYDIPKDWESEIGEILVKIDKMNHKKGGRKAKLITELKRLEESMIDAEIPQKVLLKMLEKGYRVTLGVNFNGRFKELVKYFKEKGYNIGIINGSVISTKREKIAEDFRWGKLDVVIMNKDAGAEGTSFQNLSDDGKPIFSLYFADNKYQKDIQFSGRSRRLGMKSDVIVARLFPWVNKGKIHTLSSIIKSTYKKKLIAKRFMTKDLSGIKLPGEYIVIDKNFKKIQIEIE